ncbi:hypothetical protein ACFSUS_08550 [Spirosoma soli]|uniref:Uma2 family endonuclease n=1 Tax=Spirosoma soli TaxID=1770529 RepID=A0ABW5M0W8_9BACT
MQEIQAALNEERKKREAFYNDITDEFKPGRRALEFINGDVVMHWPVKKMHNEVTGFLYQLFNTYMSVSTSLALLALRRS